MRAIDITGQKFRKLTALCVDGHHRNGQIMWLCQCDCGQKISVLGNNLRAGRTRSCGCLQLAWVRNGKPAFRHGGTKTSEFDAWAAMRERCRPNYPRYRDYHDRGIIVCERWEDFRKFLADMGRRPSSKHSLDRIDNNGNYEPSNCRWATKSEQAHNRRKFSALTNYTDAELLAECKRRGLIHAQSESGNGVRAAEPSSHPFSS